MNELDKILAFMVMEQNKKIERYHQLNYYAQKGGIVLSGSSLMELFPINELMMGMENKVHVFNRGVSGIVSRQLLEHIEPLILELEPSKLLINIGTNDLGLSDNWLKNLLENYETILKRVKSELPDCVIIMLAYYPVADETRFPDSSFPGAISRTNEMIDTANAALEVLADRQTCHFINVNNAISDEKGFLKSEFASDPVHMWPSAYFEVLKHLMPFLR